MAGTNLYAKISRLKDFIKFFIQKFQPICCFCKVPIDWLDFFPNLVKKLFEGKMSDSITIHHKDHNRENDSFKNKAISHRICHRRHHREEQLYRELNPKKFVYELYENVNGRVRKEVIKV